MKQAMTEEVRQATDEGGKKSAQKAHQGRQIRPRKLTAPNRVVGPREGEGKLWLPYG